MRVEYERIYMRQLIIGLTGLIGSGKSLVAEYFALLGAKIIDTDAIAHELTSIDGGAIALIQQKFGIEFIGSDGSLNRAKMRNLVFSDDMARQNLEAILHNLIFAQVIHELEQTVAKFVIVVVPLLFKSAKYLAIIHRSIFVDCPEDELIRRVKMRSQLNDATISNILLLQMPRLEQLQLASDVIENNGSTMDLRNKVSQLYQQYMKLIEDL